MLFLSLELKYHRILPLYHVRRGPRPEFRFVGRPAELCSPIPTSLRHRDCRNRVETRTN
jgi:hypothetical protein